MSYGYLLAEGLRVVCFFSLGSGRNVTEMLVVCGCGGPIFELFRIFWPKTNGFRSKYPRFKERVPVMAEVERATWEISCRNCDRTKPG